MLLLALGSAEQTLLQAPGDALLQLELLAWAAEHFQSPLGVDVGAEALLCVPLCPPVPWEGLGDRNKLGFFVEHVQRRQREGLGAQTL